MKHRSTWFCILGALSMVVGGATARREFACVPVAFVGMGVILAIVGVMGRDEI